MRTITLTEWRPKNEALTSEEVRSVAAASKFVRLSVSSDLDGGYTLTAGSKVGTIVFDDLRILIRPKVGLRNLFFLLGFRGGLIKWSEESFPYEDEPDLLRTMAWLFERETSRAMPYGLARDYVSREDALIALRGRIDIGRQLSRWSGQVIPIECRFQEYTEDIPLNRVLKAAHREMLRVTGVEPVVARRLRGWVRGFVDVEDVPYRAASLPRLHFTRLNGHWELAARLAELILAHETVTDREGTVRGRAFTVDMNKLFEKFFEEVLRDECVLRGWELVAQADRYLTTNIVTHPDFVLARSGLDRAVGDAKYKRLDIEDMPHADLYQLLAYCVSLGLPRGLLVYATFEPMNREVVRHAGVELCSIGLDMTGLPDAILAEARGAARQLIEQAERAELDELRDPTVALA